MTKKARKDLCADCRKKKAQRRFLAKKGKCAEEKPERVKPAAAAHVDGLDTKALEEALEMGEMIAEHWSLPAVKKARLISALYNARVEN